MFGAYLCCGPKAVQRHFRECRADQVDEEIFVHSFSRGRAASPFFLIAMPKPI